MNSKKTIIYVGGFELPDKNAAAQRVVSNAKLLRDLGYKVVLVDSCRDQEVEMAQKERCYEFERWSIKKSNKQLYSVEKVLCILKKYTDTVAVIAYNYPSIGLNKLRKYCNKNKIKIIADVTEWYGVQGENIVHKIIKGLDSYFRMNIIQPKLDGIIAISHYLERYYKNKTNTVFLPPLTDKEEEKWKPTLENSDENKIKILFAGTLGRGKDKLNLILRAIKDCDRTKYFFEVIGLTKEQYLMYYPEDYELLYDLNNNVLFAGRKSHNEVIKELKVVDFSLFYRDVNRVTMAGFPTKFAEAITAGTPVLTNKTSDLTDYLVEGINGFWINNIDTDLNKILSKDISELKNLKNNIKTETFDYRVYVNTVRDWLNQII